MIAALIRLCIQKRLAAILITLVVALYGLQAYFKTPIEAYPDVTNVQVNVVAQLSGAAPEEIERQVTIPLERALNGTPDMIQMRSESLFGLSILWLVFNDEADAFKARTRIAERLLNAELPEEAEVKLAPDATPLGKVYYYRLTSDRHSLYDIRSEQEWTVTRVLKQVPGVADVVGMGGYLKELHVEVDPARMAAYGLTLLDITEALEASNKNVGGGIKRNGDQQLVIRGIGYLRTPKDVEDVVLESEGGTPVTVGDVGRVIQAFTPRQGTVGYNEDRDIVEGIVLLRRGENPDTVLSALKLKIDELNREILPEGMALEPMYDRSTLTGHTLETVNHNLVNGFLLIVGLVWLFLRSMRGSLIVAIVIPLSLLTAFAGLYLLGLPANLISMGAIDFGILVDGAVVLVENVIHEMRHHKPQTKREVLSLVASSAIDVARPTFYAMAIIIAALIPVFTLESVEGRIFRPLALTYSFALIGALVFALTVVPALLALTLRPRDAELRDPKFLIVLRNGYNAVLRAALRARIIPIALALGLLAAGGAVATRIGTEFLPELDEGDLYIFVEMPPSVSLESGQNILAEVRRKIMEFPEVLATPSEQGRPEDGLDNEGTNMAKVFARLRPKETWRRGLTKEQLIDDMRVSLAQIPGVSFNFSQPIKDSVEEAVSGVRGKIVVKVFGTDLAAMRETLVRVIDNIEDVPGVVDLGLYRDSSVPQLQILLDRAALARSGISVAAADSVIETAMAGHVVTNLWQDERLVPVRVRLPAVEKADVTSIGEILVPSPAGARIPLRDLADIKIASGRASVIREANRRYLALKFNVEGRDMGSTVKDAMAVVDQKVTVPEGQYLTWGGEFENQQRAMARLQVIVPIALLIVLGLLYGALGSGLSAVLVMLCVPFALTGGLFALWGSGIALSVSAAVGFIALLGQVSLAGLLVVSAIDRLRGEGVENLRAVVDGATSRFRALLMTALLAMLGLMPMAVSTGMGSETQKPFAVVIIGGMVTTLFVALFILPAFCSFFSRSRNQPSAEAEIEPPAH
ncbi:efflux RND transporter permease subunit [Nannocystis radixulma]|uniref:CusA/CzcA family heavy metal efflux RND transporter n=1 Tax=Nannocystis radixulma TaxID=2995305 RepID=A0ABT5B796_9BACT|nr:CusA/CzcA family heavy metal efflux RND transporter [Nannocystis radixulma]MDC0669389.1 CusA/CzcA family heavy metal efflux RND transporter [Nannocystis radixulma]